MDWHHKLILKISSIIGENFELGKHKGGLNSLSFKCGVHVSSLRRMYEGSAKNIDIICKVLDALGYKIEVVKKEDVEEQQI